MRILGLKKAWTFVWQRNKTVWLRSWATNVIPPMLQPLTLLLIMGLGVGRFVGKVDGMAYAVFVTAGVMVTESLMRATFECTYGSFYRMTYQKTFEAIITTPVTPYEVAFGEIIWGATKSIFSALILFIAMFAIGVCRNATAPLALLVVAVGGVNFAAISLAVSAKAREFEQFQFFFAVMFPLTFICGAYFPLSNFPPLVQNALWLIPLTHIVDVTRGLISGSMVPYMGLKLAYIAASTVFVLEVALRLMAKRLID